MTVMILFLVSVVCLISAIYIYTRAEDNDFKKFTEAVQTLRGEIKSQQAKDVDIEKAIDEIKNNVISLPEEMRSLREEVDAVQDHCSKLRDSQIELRDRSYPRKVELKVKHYGAIPVEIYPGPARSKVNKVITNEKKSDTTKAPAKRKANKSVERK